MNSQTQQFRQFVADLSQLSMAVGFAGQTCTALGLPVTTCLRAELVVEELFSNTVRHGYDQNTADAERPIWIAITADNNSVIVTYQDAAPPHNPLVEDPDLAERTVSRRHIGGLGRVLVRDLPGEISYSIEDNRNTLRFRLDR
jgi:serine/threonine-protein kinase RsbW